VTAQKNFGEFCLTIQMHETGARDIATDSNRPIFSERDVT